MDFLYIFLLALAIDLLFGELPRAIHPVVWMGKLTSLLCRFCNRSKPSSSKGGFNQLLYGILITMVIVALFSLPVYFLLSFLHDFNMILYILFGALLFKATFAFRELRTTSLKIKSLLVHDDLTQARDTARSLVSRDVNRLNEPGVVSSTVESMAENLSDSFVAPLFYFCLLGVSGAMAYRVVNTLDAMIGYHGEYEYLGKFAARLDDVLNFIPARISGLLIVAAAWTVKNARNAWRIMLRDHGKTASPNAGWPMSAVAGALRTRLEKAGHYILGDSNSPLSPQLISSGVKVIDRACLIWTVICLLAGGISIVVTS